MIKWIKAIELNEIKKPANGNYTVSEVVLEKCRIDTYRRNGENRMPDYWPIVRLARQWAKLGAYYQQLFHTLWRL